MAKCKALTESAMKGLILNFAGIYTLQPAPINIFPSRPILFPEDVLDVIVHTEYEECLHGVQ